MLFSFLDSLATKRLELLVLSRNNFVLWCVWCLPKGLHAVIPCIWSQGSCCRLYFLGHKNKGGKQMKSKPQVKIHKNRTRECFFNSQFFGRRVKKSLQFMWMLHSPCLIQKVALSSSHVFIVGATYLSAIVNFIRRWHGKATGTPPNTIRFRWTNIRSEFWWKVSFPYGEPWIALRA